MDRLKPDVWDDDTRMNVLFSPFREKDLNPSSWNQKMKFWIQIIEDEHKLTNKCTIEGKSLPQMFKRKGKIPTCLETVLSEMLSLGKIRKLQNCDILQPPSGSGRKGWLTWGYDTLVKSPISWGWKTLTKESSEEDNPRYILESCLNDQCSKVLERLQCQMYCDIVNSIMEYSEVYSQCGDLCSSELEFKVAIQQLVKERKAVISTEEDSVIIKFCAQNDDKVKNITGEDLKIFRIKKTSSALMSKMEKLSVVGERLKKEAIQYRNKSMKQHSLRTFKQYKRVQDRISKLSNSIDLLDDILHRIGHAASEEMVVKAIESGAQALKGINERNDLDKVSDVMDDLSQAMQDQEEIQAELSRIDHEEEESLEASLDSLLLEDGKSAVDDQQVDGRKQASSEDELSDLLAGLKLPDVPTFSPGKSKEFSEMESQSEIFVPDLSPSDRLKRSKEAA
ncbi:charged multivesicular body protein 7 [Magallana gigas]|uniref:charged multivesicular body protein 7 n=1 Tax=Magallana gigas TaxID=29159 RepID=UPI00333F32BE